MNTGKRFRSLSLLPVVLAVAAILAGPADAGFSFHRNGIDGSGDMETRSFDLDDFDRIRLDGGMDLDIRFDDTFSVDVTLDDNLMEILVVEVSGSTLLIDFEEDCDPDNDSRATIVLPRLRGMTINGAGDIDIHDFKGDVFEFTLHGACNLDIDGEVDEFEIDLAGAGDINAREFKAEDVEVRLSGAGDVDLTATKSIEARLSGVGSIAYWGDPDREKTRVSGIGRIKRK